MISKPYFIFKKINVGSETLNSISTIIAFGLKTSQEKLLHIHSIFVPVTFVITTVLQGRYPAVSFCQEVFIKSWEQVAAHACIVENCSPIKGADGCALENYPQLEDKCWLA